MVPKALAGDRGVLQNIKLAKELYRVFSGAHVGAVEKGVIGTVTRAPIYSEMLIFNRI